MSRMTDFTVPSTVPGRTLHAFCCEPEGEVRAVLQLSHGMVEFIDRYKPLAEYLAGQGIVVVGHDHLGHGGSIRTKADYGYFAEPDGNRAVLDDLHAMTLRTKERYPGVPYFLLGHSMGSFYARQYLCEYGQELSGAIIMGTGHQPKALVQFARSTCRALAAVHGWQYRSKLVANLSFMGYNKGLEGRTTHDWLNRDAAEVDKYLADERCTFTFTLNAYYSMFSGILRLHDPAFLARMPKDLPPAVPGRHRRPGGRPGQGRAARHPEPEGRRRAEHPLQAVPRRPARTAGGDQPAGSVCRHCRLAERSAALTTLHRTFFAFFKAAARHRAAAFCLTNFNARCPRAHRAAAFFCILPVIRVFS